MDTYVRLEQEGTLNALSAGGTWSDQLRSLFSGFAPEKPVWVTEELERFFPQEWAKVEAMRDFRTAKAKELFVKAVEQGEIRSDISPAIIELTVAGAMAALYDYRNLERVNMTFNQALAEFNKILFTGILNKNAR